MFGHHLVSVLSLPGYVSEELNRLPAPADCTQEGLLGAEFGEDLTNGLKKVGAVEHGWNVDHVPLGVVGGERAGRDLVNANAHAEPPIRRRQDISRGGEHRPSADGTP
jgi:hypothetical protein